MSVNNFLDFQIRHFFLDSAAFRASASCFRASRSRAITLKEYPNTFRWFLSFRNVKWHQVKSRDRLTRDMEHMEITH